MKNSKFKEKILLLKVKNLDEKAFSAIYDLYVNRIYRYIYYKISHEAEAEDLTSRVFLKMWNYINSKKANEISNLNAFLYKIAKNIVIDYYKTKNDEVVILEDIDLINIENTNVIINKVENDSELKQILDALPKLKKEQQEIIILKYIEDLSTKEIAEILDKSQTAVRVMQHRALNNLKKIINATDN